jgi:hypothetical protein
MDKCDPRLAAPIRGYDSDELFRQDLWLRRIADSRQKLARVELSMCAVACEDQANQLFAMLVPVLNQRRHKK